MRVLLATVETVLSTKGVLGRLLGRAARTPGRNG